MDVSSIAKLSTSIAETGQRQELSLAVMKKAQQIQEATATQLLEALPAAQPARLPAHLGNKIDTTA
ncbi:YjfB family protein [Massilia oculi]|uniref:YjfB family protein n=1 Tax=Massilia hydrophila TaxID=3044279 RepID=A0ABS7YED3_9BURK|nr:MULTISPECIES: YjfB family protein [Massilia]MCA1246966.1 YjfB family protein [Massilia sp. MS-15]MCA1858071.1 YjfB family protein [Massilia oculi]